MRTISGVPETGSGTGKQTGKFFTSGRGREVVLGTGVWRRRRITPEEVGGTFCRGKSLRGMTTVNLGTGSLCVQKSHSCCVEQCYPLRPKFPEQSLHQHPIQHETCIPHQPKTPANSSHFTTRPRQLCY